MTDGLKDAHREAIIAVIAANDRVERAVLFGSRATGTNTVSSDVDIALYGDRLTLTDHARLAAALDEIPMAQSVDLLLCNSIKSPTLLHHIQAHGIELYAFREKSRSRGTKSERAVRSRSARNTWAETWLGQVIELKRGYDLPGRERLPGPAPVVSSSGVTGYHRESKVPGPGVVTGRYGTLGEVYFIPGDFWPLNTTLYVRDFKGNDPRFISYLLRGLDFSGHSDKAAVPGLNRNHLHEEPVRVPTDVREQRAIAHVLGTLDDKIELNRRMNATLEAMARALFRSWFVDFDPVRAKMEGRDIGLPREIADQFPDRLVDSELGEIPEGWRAGTLADVARLNPESWSNHNAPARILYVDLAKTKWGEIDVIQMFSWADAPSRARRVLRRGDTIVGTVRPGNGSFALIDREDLTGSTGFAVLRPADPIEREIVWCAATSADTIDRLAHLADGGAYPAVSPKAILDVAVVLPDEHVRLAFSSMAAPLLNRLKANQREARILSTLRDALLPKLVSGELQVTVAERANVHVDRPASVGTHGA